jgi:hypothetical protein
MWLVLLVDWFGWPALMVDCLVLLVDGFGWFYWLFGLFGWLYR